MTEGGDRSQDTPSLSVTTAMGVRQQRCLLLGSTAHGQVPTDRQRPALGPAAQGIACLGCSSLGDLPVPFGVSNASSPGYPGSGRKGLPLEAPS